MSIRSVGGAGADGFGCEGFWVDGFFFTKIEGVDIFCREHFRETSTKFRKIEENWCMFNKRWNISIVDLEGNSAIKPFIDAN